jgi:hypothetical protein
MFTRIFSLWSHKLSSKLWKEILKHCALRFPVSPVEHATGTATRYFHLSCALTNELARSVSQKAGRQAGYIMPVLFNLSLWDRCRYQLIIKGFKWDTPSFNTTIQQKHSDLSREKCNWADEDTVVPYSLATGTEVCADCDIPGRVATEDNNTLFFLKHSNIIPKNVVSVW